MNARSIFAAAAVGIALAACSAGGFSSNRLMPDSVARASHAWSPNLIVNGDAELGDSTASGYDAVTIPGWQPQGLPTVVAYGDTGFPSDETPGPPHRGKNFFAGGQLGSYARGKLGDSSLMQTVSVAAAAAAIDAGSVRYDLSGWLGGFARQRDNARVIATFIGARGGAQGSVTLGPVTREDRKNVTSLLYRDVQGTVPRLTRSIGVLLANTRYSGYDDGYADDLSLRISASVAAPAAPTPPPAHVPPFDHVYQIMMENEWFPEIVGNVKDAPYINSLIATNALLANEFSLTHPSDPNYVAMASGSTYGLDSDAWKTTTIDHRHLADLVEASGRSWKVYMQGTSETCDQKDHGYYYPDDSPYMFFKDVRDDLPRCRAHIVPISEMAADFASDATTPDYAWIAPNDCSDMESCGIKTGDAWLSKVVPIITGSPSWKAGKSMIIVTWDEDDYHHNQHVPAFIVGPDVKAGYRSPQFYTHYSVLRTVEAAFSLPTLTLNDLYANPINDVWK